MNDSAEIDLAVQSKISPKQMATFPWNLQQHMFMVLRGWTLNHQSNCFSTWHETKEKLILWQCDLSLRINVIILATPLRMNEKQSNKSCYSFHTNLKYYGMWCIFLGLFICCHTSGCKIAEECQGHILLFITIPPDWHMGVKFRANCETLQSSRPMQTSKLYAVAGQHSHGWLLKG